LTLGMVASSKISCEELDMASVRLGNPARKG